MGDLSTANGGASRILARPDNATLLFSGIGTPRHAHRVLDAGRRAGSDCQGQAAGDRKYTKSRQGGFAALVDPTIIRNRAAAERTLRAKVDADAALRAQYGAVWDNISATLVHYRGTLDRYRFAERGDGFRSQLFGFAKTLVRHAAELSKPDQMRLPEYTDANFPEQRQLLLSIAPIYPELETFTLTFSLTKLREALGPDDPFVKKVLGKNRPSNLRRNSSKGQNSQASSFARNCSMVARPRSLHRPIR